MHLRLRRWSRLGFLFGRFTHIIFDCYLRNQKDWLLISLFRVVLDVLENQVKSSPERSVLGNTNALTSVGPIEGERASHPSNVGKTNVRRTIIVILANCQKVIATIYDVRSFL